MQALLTEIEAQDDHLDSYRKDYITYYQGVLDLQADRRDQARQTFQSLLATVTPSRLRTKLLYRMGLLEANEGRFDAATYYYDQSLRQCETHHTCHQWEYARIHRDLGNAYARGRKWDEAVHHLEQSLAIWQAIDDRLGVVETYNDLGNTFQQQRLPEQAVDFYLKGLELLRRAKDTWRVARVYNNLGAFYEREQEWDKASLYFSQSLEVKRGLGDRCGIATTYNNMANMLVRKGEVERNTQPLQQALQYYENSLHMFRELGDRLGMANTLYNLAYVHRRVGHWEQALSCIDESLSLYQSLGSEETQEAAKLRHEILRQT
jgi:tetratricopeptide (TPR) repeat protein